MNFRRPPRCDLPDAYRLPWCHAKPHDRWGLWESARACIKLRHCACRGPEQQDPSHPTTVLRVALCRLSPLADRDQYASTAASVPIRLTCTYTNQRGTSLMSDSITPAALSTPHSREMSSDLAPISALRRGEAAMASI